MKPHGWKQKSSASLTAAGITGFRDERNLYQCNDVLLAFFSSFTCDAQNAFPVNSTCCLTVEPLTEPK